MNTLLQEQMNQLHSLLDGAQEVIIAVPKNPSFDTLAGALSFYLTLSAANKRVTVVCPDQMTVEFSRLVGADKVTTRINGTSGRNLIISFPYQEGSIEKVSYNIEDGAFNLVIEPRENYPRITPEMMNYSYSGGKTDLIITINAHQLSDLDLIYSTNNPLFSNTTIINIDMSSQNQQFGKINIVDPSTSSVSELMTSIMSQTGLSIDSDSAANLLAGIISGTNNFSSTTTQASTFETAALLVKKGAKKNSLTEESNPIQTSFNPPVVKAQGSPKSVPFTPSPKPSFQPRVFNQRPKQNQAPGQQSPVIQQSYAPPTNQSHPLQGQPQTPRFSPQAQNIPQKPINEAPPDWLKPKIYKSSTLL